MDNVINSELWSIRIKSFLYEAGSVILTAVCGVLVSDDFSNLLTEHFGEGLIVSVVLLLISGGVKHLRNLQVIKKVGATGKRTLI